MSLCLKSLSLACASSMPALKLLVVLVAALLFLSQPAAAWDPLGIGAALEML